MIMKNTVAILTIFILLSGGINLLEAKKSTALALGLSVGAPALGWVAAEHFGSITLATIAVTVCPSAGHFYAEQLGPAAVFTGLRTITIVGAVLIVQEAIRTDPEYGGFAIVPVGMIALGMCGALSLVEWLFIPSSVQRYNERFEIKPEIDFQNARYGIGFVYRL